MRDGLFFDKKFLTTESIPGNLGSGTDETEIYLVQPSGLFLGDGNNAEIESTSTGSYQVGGNLVSTFATDSVAFKITQQHDLETRHLNAVAVAEAIRWDA